MQPQSTIKHAVATAAALAGSVALACGQAVDDEQLLQLESDAALAAAVKKAGDAETQVRRLEGSNVALAKALAEANEELAVLRQELDSALRRLEGSGASPDSGADQADARMLGLLNDLRLAERDKEDLVGAIVALSEAALRANGGGQAPQNAELEEVIASANRTIRRVEGGFGAEGSNVGVAATVVDIKPELGLVVLGGGESLGLSEGAKVNLYRSGQIVASALIVDARRTVAGAIVTGADEDRPVQKGDVARLDINNALKN